MQDEQFNQSPSPKPESSKNQLVVVIIIFVVLIMLAVFGFWGYSIYQAKQIATENAKESATVTSTASLTASATVSASANDYVIYDSNTREVTKSELQPLSEWQLKIARNEIYARYGRQFEHQDLQCYFNKQPWYKTDPAYSESTLTSIENKNITTITEYEKEINSSYLNYDSGCSNL